MRLSPIEQQVIRDASLRWFGVRPRQFCLQVLLEPVEDSSLADILNLLEQRGYLAADEWRSQRAMRNTLTHEYPEQVTWQAEALNRSRVMSLQLIDWLTRFRAEFERRKTT